MTGKIQRIGKNTLQIFLIALGVLTISGVGLGQSIPPGYVVKETLCYKIAIPQNNTAGEENNCDKSYSSYIDTPEYKKIYNLTTIWVNTDREEYQSSKEMAEKWVQKTKDKTDVVFWEGDVGVGGVGGYMVLTKNNISRQQRAIVFMSIAGRYKSQGVPIKGFEITKALGCDDNASETKMKEAKWEDLKIILSTWQWK